MFASQYAMAQGTAVQPSAGNGSAGNPYQLASLDNLIWWQDHINNSCSHDVCYAKLVNDISLDYKITLDKPKIDWDGTYYDYDDPMFDYIKQSPEDYGCESFEQFLADYGMHLVTDAHYLTEFEFTHGKLVLDLNGHNISADNLSKESKTRVFRLTGTDDDKVELTINDGSLDKSGAISITKTDMCFAIFTLKKAKITVNAGQFYMPSKWIFCQEKETDDAEFVINNGNFWASYIFFSIKSAASANIIVNGGVFSSKWFFATISGDEQYLGEGLKFYEKISGNWVLTTDFKPFHKYSQTELTYIVAPTSTCGCSSYVLSNEADGKGLYDYECSGGHGNQFGKVKVMKDFLGSNIELATIDGNYSAIKQITLTDDKGYTAPFSFTSAASYSRSIKANWNTICLPFAAQGTEDMKFYTVKSLKNGVITLELTQNLPAGKPALVYTTSKENLSIKGTGALATAPSNASGTNRLVGAFQNATVQGATDTSHLYYGLSANTGNYVKVASDVALKPFRAYIECDKNAANEAGLRMSFVDDVETTAISEVISTLNSTDAEYYDLNGSKQSGLKKGMNIIKVGNKTQKVFVK